MRLRGLRTPSSQYQPAGEIRPPVKTCLECSSYDGFGVFARWSRLPAAPPRSAFSFSLLTDSVPSTFARSGPPKPLTRPERQGLPFPGPASPRGL